MKMEEKMTEEHHKLVAKIQHFYELMIDKAEKAEDTIIASYIENERIRREGKLYAFNTLINEYSKVFDAFLYKD